MFPKLFSVTSLDSLFSPCEPMRFGREIGFVTTTCDTRRNYFRNYFAFCSDFCCRGGERSIKLPQTRTQHTRTKDRTMTANETTRKPDSVVQTRDKFARMNGMFWEARFSHPTLGCIVLPYATRKEAEASRLKN